jgi:methyl-accepting chemotaxis protein
MTESQQAQWEQFEKVHTDFVSLPDQILELRGAADWNKSQYLLKTAAVPLAQRVTEDLAYLKTLANQRVVDDQKLLRQASTALTASLVTATLLAVLVGGAFTLVMGRRLVGTIKRAVETVATTAAQMSRTADQQQQLAQQQAAAVNELTTTMEQLTRSSESSAQQAGQALEQARHVLGLARNGTQIVDQTISGMNNLNDRVNDVAQQIVHLSDQNSQIAAITDLVRDLAKRTNVLALNASVEAAQAGEQGAGFAVVAAEIRKLAEESGLSANRIQQLVDQIQSSTNSTVMATEEGTKTLKSGTDLAQKTTEAFHEVAGSVGVAVEDIQQISLNVKEQAHAIGHVGDAMDDINRGARENEKQASSLKQGVGRLQEAVAELQAIV